MCVPAEGDKGVTGSSEVSLVISHWQPCLPRGRFNQTLAELISDPSGLCASPTKCPQLTLDQQARIYLMLDGIRGVAFYRSII